MRSTSLVFLVGGLLFLHGSIWAQGTISYSDSIDSLFLVYDEQINTNPNQALKTAQYVLDFSRANKDERNQARARYGLGRAYYMSFDMDSARVQLEKGVALATTIGDTVHLVLCKKWMGSVWRQQSNLIAALKSYEEALLFAESISLRNEIPKITQNIAGIFLDLKQNNKAIEYFEKSLRQLSDPYSKSVCSSNLGLAYLSNQQFELALAAFKKSLEYCAQVNNQLCDITPLERIASTYLDQGKFNIALKYGLEVLEKRKEQNSKPHLVDAYHRVGLIYLNLGQFEEAINYFNYCMNLEEYIQPSNRPFIHANLALAYDSLQHYEQASRHLWKFVQANDTLKSIESERHINSLLAKFDTERKEKEILLLQKEKELQESELTRQTLIRNIAITGVIMAVFILLAIRKLYSQSMKSQQELANKQQEINEQKTKELIQENELKATKANIEGQEQERKRIAQELHDGIAGNLATMKLHLLDLSNSNESSIDQVISQMDTTYEQVRSLSHHLMPPSTQKATLIELISSYLEELKPRLSFALGFHFHPKEVIDQLDANSKHELFRITQELMNNIIKHANPSQVDIQLNVNNDELNLMVEDDGGGFDLTKTSHGIGLKSVDSRVKKLNGQCHIDSKPNRGTTISIDIPIQIASTHEV